MIIALTISKKYVYDYVNFEITKIKLMKLTNANKYYNDMRT